MAPAASWIAAAGWDGHLGIVDVPSGEPEAPDAAEAAWGMDLQDVVGPRASAVFEP